MKTHEIIPAEKSDLRAILDLQYPAYRSEAQLFGTQNIPSLKQTLEKTPRTCLV